MIFWLHKTVLSFFFFFIYFFYEVVYNCESVGTLYWVKIDNYLLIPLMQSVLYIVLFSTTIVKCIEILIIQFDVYLGYMSDSRLIYWIDGNLEYMVIYMPLYKIMPIKQLTCSCDIFPTSGLTLSTQTCKLTLHEYNNNIWSSCGWWVIKSLVLVVCVLWGIFDYWAHNRLSFTYD